MYKSQRFFQLWQYTTSHNQLLLRSNKRDEYSTRIDILFKDVSVIVLQPFLEGLQVELCDSLELPRNFNFKVGPRNLYKVVSVDTSGYIAAASMAVHEDEGEYFTPSALLPRDLSFA
jgi:hypothetical protein